MWKTALYCSQGLVVWLLSVWESFPIDPLGNATCTISAAIRKIHIPLLAKRITCHGYALTGLHTSTVASHSSNRAHSIAQHYWHHSFLTSKPLALRRNTQQGHVTNVGVGSSSSIAFLVCVFVKSVERVNRLLDCTSKTVSGHSLWLRMYNAFFFTLVSLCLVGFPVSTSECWAGSQVSKLLLHASHVALPN
jgi:hypothetical protein